MGTAQATFAGERWETTGSDISHVTGSGLTGSDVSHVTKREPLTGSMFCACATVSCATVSRIFFLTLVVVQNVPLCMTGSTRATGSDRRSRDSEGVEGCEHAQPEVGYRK